MKTKHGFWILLGSVSSALSVAQTSPPAAGSGLEEIVVTAQKRSENVQSVPLSMTTFTSAALEAKAINTFFDYATKVPNLAFAPTGDGVGTARTVSIRGVSGDNVTGFYIDDTPLPDSLDPRVLDIDHIEVLRGPQGTLYGARSMGGTVRIITKQPNLDDFDATVHAGVSDTARTDRANGTGDAVVNIPLIKGIVALRLSGFYDQESGYFTRSYCTNPATAGNTCLPLSKTGVTTVPNVGATDTYGTAASVTIKATDDLTITPRIMQQRSSYNGFLMADVLSMPNNGYGYPVPSGPYTLPSPLVPTDFNQARFFNDQEGGYDAWYLTSLAVKWKAAVGELVSSTSYFSRYVYEKEDQTDFVYAAITQAAGGTPQPGPVVEIKDYQRLAQELRFASSLSGPVQFVVGGFYSDVHGRVPYAGYYPPAEVPGLDATLGGPNNPDYPNLIAANDFQTDIRDSATFGELTFQATEALKFTGGIRYFEVQTTSNGYEEGLAAGGPKVVSPRITTTETGFTPKFEADYHLTSDQMIYVNVAKGFRPGGLVPIVPPGTPNTATDCVAALQQQDPNTTLANTRSYQSDSLWNYELGGKTTWLDRRLTVNAAIFDIRWKNIQQAVLLFCGYQFIANAGAAESKGGEFEVNARATEALELSLGIGYQNAKITEAGASSPQAVGSPIYQVPDWTGNASATYTIPLGAHWTLANGIDYSYVGRSFSGNNDPIDPRERPAYRLIDARFALSDGRTEVALVGKNLANEAANLGDNRSIAAEVPGRPRLLVNQPRTIGLEVREHF
jgi:outer membrane receptor protein involved in Fe transport